MQLNRTGLIVAFVVSTLAPAAGPSLMAQPSPTELFLRGYSVVPAPRRVELSGDDLLLDDSWAVTTDTLPQRHIAVRSLLTDLLQFHHLALAWSAESARPRIRLAVEPGTVVWESNPPEAAIQAQAYRLTLAPTAVDIVGNSDAGLFYGVQTLLQLARRSAEGRLQLPIGTIEDWPGFELRFLHWDTKHHQDRMETLRRYLDWAARFKINRVAFELEDKFEYPSHPVIGAPGAFTTAQLQELVDYGLERFIQIVPDVQAPAHFAYVLKHPEFAHLRADGNNYQACLCDEESYRLIFSMFEDVIEATRGVDSFLASTDEVYYAGICGKCREPYNPDTRSRKWVEFAQRARDFLHQRGRRMISWVEYPLRASDISRLPADLIDGVLGSDPAFIEEERKVGIRQLVYTSMQGSEYLFPDYWSTHGGDFRSRQGRLWSTYRTLSVDAGRGNPIGVFGAAWGDSGLHNETFWLGWATVAQYGWTPGTPSVEQHVEDFVRTFYGGSGGGIVTIYQDLQRQARFFQQSWDREVSRVRAPGYGNSRGPGIGVTRRDDTLPQPALPSLPDLEFAPVYVGRYAGWVEAAGQMADQAQSLIHRIYAVLPGTERNRYNLEVLLSLARLTAHHDRLLLALAAIEEQLAEARNAAAANQPEGALEKLVRAYQIAFATVRDRTDTFTGLRRTWEKSQYPKNRSVEGRTFLHVLDDTKDHFADRRADLSYLVAPEESIDLEGWMGRLQEVLSRYAGHHGLSLDSIVLDQEPE